MKKYSSTFFGNEIYQLAPPILELTQTENGDVLLSGTDIEQGQKIWHSLGGMQRVSIEAWEKSGS